MPLIHFLWLCESLLYLFFFYEVESFEFELLNTYGWYSCNIYEMQKKYLMGIHLWNAKEIPNGHPLFLWSVFGRTFLIQIFLCEDAIFFQSVHIASRKPLTPAHVQGVFFQFECGERGTGSMTEMVFRAPGWLTECEKVIQSPRHLSYGLGLGLRAASALISVFWTRL